MLRVEQVALFISILNLLFPCNNPAVRFDNGHYATLGRHTGLRIILKALFTSCGCWRRIATRHRVSIAHCWTQRIVFVSRVESVAVPVPGVEELDALALVLRPLVSVG